MRFILGWGLLLGLALAQTQETYYSRCQNLYQAGALESAQSLCELALSLDPTHQPSLRLLARIALDKGALTEAKAYLERLGQDPEAQVLWARAYLLQNRPKEVLALPLPDTAEGTLLKALALERLRRHPEALALALNLPQTPEARLLKARLLTRLGRPEEALSLLGETREERVERGWLLFLTGRPQEAAQALEKELPGLVGQRELYRKALQGLTWAYLAQGRWGEGLSALRSLAQVENLPLGFLARAWPWLLVLLVFLGLLLYGESRIEPVRGLEVVENPRPGPGLLLLLILGGLLLAFLLSYLLGQALFQNGLALLAPYQGERLLPSFLLFYGAFLLLALAFLGRRYAPDLPQVLGPWPAWTEGFWVGPGILLLLLAYGFLRPFLGLSTLPLDLLAFLGLALMEPFFRGLVPEALRERYRELAPKLSVLLFALVVPGPTLLWLLLGAGLLWAKRYTGGSLGLALGWVVAGVVLALLPSAWHRFF